MIHLRALLPLVACIAATFLTSCASGPDHTWVDERFEARTETHLRQVIYRALDAGDYAANVVDSDPSKRRIETGWKVDLSPFKNQGWRKKAHVEYGPAADEAGERVNGEWDVKVRVEMERNASFRGTEIQYADWEAIPDDEAGARFIVLQMRALLGGGDFRVEG